VPLKQELFGSGYHHSFEKTLTPTEVKPYLPYASAAGFIYSTNPSYVLSGWECIPPETLNLTSESVEARDKCFFDPDSGFKVTLLQKRNEVIVCVGAIEAQEQEKARSPKYQKAKNIAQSILGVMPPVYKQALAFAKKIQACPQFAGKKLTLTGQCYGGAIASYLALKTKLPAVCLNSFPLGAGVQYDIGKDVLSEADKYVTHISSRHDFLTDLPFYTPMDLAVSALGIRAPGSFGRKYLIPTAYSDPLMSHAYILSSVLQHLGYDKRAHPKDLPLE
jgi:dienelactone hydrolase